MLGLNQGILVSELVGCLSLPNEYMKAKKVLKKVIARGFFGLGKNWPKNARNPKIVTCPI